MVSPPLPVEEWNDRAIALGNPFAPCSVIRVWCEDFHHGVEWSVAVPRTTPESMACAFKIAAEAILIATDNADDVVFYPVVDQTKHVSLVSFRAGWSRDTILSAIQRVAQGTSGTGKTWPTYKIEVKQ